MHLLLNFGRVGLAHLVVAVGYEEGGAEPELVAFGAAGGEVPSKVDLRFGRMNGGEM